MLIPALFCIARFITLLFFRYISANLGSTGSNGTTPAEKQPSCNNTSIISTKTAQWNNSEVFVVSATVVSVPNK